MINYATILSNYDDRLTLLEWLKKVEDALKNASLDNVTITQDQPDEFYFTFVFGDGTSLDSPVITLPDGPQGPQGPQGPAGQDGADGVSVVSASIDASNHLIIVLSSGLSIDAGEIAGMQNPMTARDDLILGGVGGAPTRIAKGNNYDVLSVNDLGHIVWRAPEHVIEEAVYYSTDPAVLIGLDEDGHATEVPASEFQEALDTSSVSDGTISKAIGFDSNGDLVKETPSSGGMTNPMAQRGDMIRGGVNGAPSRLGLGTAGQVLTCLSNTMAWQDPQVSAQAIAQAGLYDEAGIYSVGDYCLYEGQLYKANTAISGDGAFNSSHWDGTSVEEELADKQDKLVSGTTIKTINGTSVLGSGNITISGGMANPMDAQGDIIYGGASGTPTKLAKGTAGQVLTMNAGATAPEWQTPSGGLTGYSGHLLLYENTSYCIVYKTNGISTYESNGDTLRVDLTNVLWIDFVHYGDFIGASGGSNGYVIGINHADNKAITIVSDLQSSGPYFARFYPYANNFALTLSD